MAKALEHLAGLNPGQRLAAEYGTEDLPHQLPGPLLIIAGAGTGKTTTLAHRVAHLVVRGADPKRVMLLTFTRRAAEVMTRRAQHIAAQVVTAGSQPPARVAWSGTFHAIGNRLLRQHGKYVGLDSSFTVLDRSDSEDLLNLVRSDLGFSKQAIRFPKKGTCRGIYSHAVNAGFDVETTLKHAFPAYSNWAEELKSLFRTYVAAKLRRNLLDYDDLLLCWFHLMESQAAESVRRRFDHVLVDEYQDTNALQARILLTLKPDGRGLTVVGDDAQSIYSFRAATVRNILDFPRQFEPPAFVIALEQNYRSTQPILSAANRVIAFAREGFPKRLFSERPSAQLPLLVTARDDQGQVDYVVERVLEHREAGIELKRQAILMRAAHHSDLLEVELGRRKIPFVKYGGLKFLEAAHVKDVLCVLRWAENPRDEVAAFRVLQLLPGVGPGHATRVMHHLESASFDFTVLAKLNIPPAAHVGWPTVCELMCGLRRTAQWQGQLGTIREWYEPQLQRLYDAPFIRAADLVQLEQLAAAYTSREAFLSDLTLDPPNALGDEGPTPGPRR